MSAKKLLLIPALLASACSVDPHIKAPSIPDAASYTAKGELVPLNRKIALGKQISSNWWTFFASQPLNGLIRMGVRNNYDLAAARETLAQAKEAVNAAGGTLLPQASIGALIGRQKYGAALFGPANFGIPPFSYYEVGPSVSWTPDLFGGEHRAVERQRALAEYQSHQLEAAYLALTGNIVAATLDIASAAEEIDMVRRILTEDEKTLRLVKEAYEIGTASKTDVLSEQTRLITDRAMLPPLEGRLAVSRHALSILVGKAPANWAPPDLKLKDFALPKTLSLSLPSELVKKRPDILAARANLHAASAAVGMADANLYPGITLTANMMQEALTPAGIFRSVSNAWSLAAGISAPIFNGGTLVAEKREAEHAYKAALAQYRQTILESFGEVADALTSLSHDDETVAMMQHAADTADSSLDLTLESYRAGAAGLLQVQDAQRAWARAQLDLVRVQHQRYLDCARLFVALGGSPLAEKT